MNLRLDSGRTCSKSPTPMSSVEKWLQKWDVRREGCKTAVIRQISGTNHHGLFRDTLEIIKRELSEVGSVSNEVKFENRKDKNVQEIFQQEAILVWWKVHLVCHRLNGHHRYLLWWLCSIEVWFTVFDYIENANIKFTWTLTYVE